jgi:internalin A
MKKNATYQFVFYGIFFLLMSRVVYSQTYTLPDANFKNKLYASYPTIFNGGGDLIIAQAATLTGPLYIDNSGISNLSGIEYFTGITELWSTGNNLSTLPLIYSANLKMLNLDYNQFTDLPNLTGLTNLEVLSFPTNPMTQLTGISNYTTLKRLNVSSCQFTVLPDLSALTNLEVLHVNINQLTQLPDLTALTKLVTLNVYNNQLTSLPNLNTLTNLEIFNASTNQLVQLPSLSSNTKITELYVYNNQLTSLPDLSSITGLSVFDCGTNSLTTLPSFGSLTQLTSFKCPTNTLTSGLPDFSSSTLLTSIDCSANQFTTIFDLSSVPNTCAIDFHFNFLTFTDILPNVSNPQFELLRIFFPQKSFPIASSINVKQYDDLVIATGIDEQLTTNTYAWTKNSSPIATVSSATLIVPAAQTTDSGTYFCQITNSHPKLTGKFLLTTICTVPVQLCFFIDRLLIVGDITARVCDVKGTLTFLNSAIQYGTPPYTVQLKSSLTSTLYNAVANQFVNLNEKKYSLVVTDQGGCVKELTDFVSVPQEECKPNVFTPDGDGVNDTYYIQDPGAVKIINSSGRVIKQLTAPAMWDGSDESGNIVPGYYIIQYSDKSVSVTLVY